MFQIRRGEKLRVRDDLVLNQAYGEMDAIPDDEVHDTDENWARAIKEIYGLRGQYVTISGIDEDGYITTEETDGMEQWGIYWMLSMFDFGQAADANMIEISQDSLFDLI